ncbi:MAG: RdgB/HAM1 family non-canonical purine NTP pyrophosphatase [Ignavibacteria bacterium]|nr:RdgB/HAM1 family non-canonical purine NTP pyrophosphatase [Ignavibacteria bacterium]
MIDKLLIATNNKDKVREIRKLFESSNIEILTLKDLNIEIEVEEDKDTLEGNALKKAEEIWKIARIPCSADDTGLFVDALNGSPGVYSSRYAGENVTYADNRHKLLHNLKKVADGNRKARFKTCVCFYYDENKYLFFEGVCEGKIIGEERGEKGFGYDAVFLPDGFNKTFAELEIDVKNRISHRAKAFEKFKEYLTEFNLPE